MVGQQGLLDGPGSLILGSRRQPHPKIVGRVAEVQAIEPVACKFEMSQLHCSFDLRKETLICASN